MNNLIFNTSYNFQAPIFNTGPLTITYNSPSNYTFRWPGAYGTNLTIIKYKLKRNSGIIQENISSTSHTLNYSSANMAQTWYVVAYNVYDEESSSLSKTITSPTFNVTNSGSFKTGSTRQFQFTYTISNFNINYNISGSGIIGISNSTVVSGIITTTQLSNTSPQTSFVIRMEDNLGFITTIPKTITIASFPATIPTSNNNILYDVYSVSISIRTNYNPNIQYYLSTSNSLLNGVSFSINSNPFNVSVLSLLVGNLYYLWGYITNGQGFFNKLYMGVYFYRASLPTVPNIQNTNQTANSITMYFNKGSNGTYSLESLVASHKLNTSSIWIDNSILISSTQHTFQALGHYVSYDIKITKGYTINSVNQAFMNESLNISTILGTPPVIALTDITYNIVDNNLEFTILDTDDGNPSESILEKRIYYSASSISLLTDVTYIDADTVFNTWSGGDTLYFKIVKVYSKYGIIQSDNILIQNLQSVNIDEDSTFFIYTGIIFSIRHYYFGERYFPWAESVSYISTIGSHIVYKTPPLSNSYNDFDKIYFYKFVKTLNQNEYYIKILKIGLDGNELDPPQYISALFKQRKWILTTHDFSKASRILLIETQNKKFNLKILNGYNGTIEEKFVDKYLRQYYNTGWGDMENFWQTIDTDIGEFDIIPSFIPILTSPTPYTIHYISASIFTTTLGLQNTKHGDYIYTHTDIMKSLSSTFDSPTLARRHNTGFDQITIYSLEPDTSYYFQAWNLYTNHNTIKSNTILITTHSLLNTEIQYNIRDSSLYIHSSLYYFNSGYRRGYAFGFANNKFQFVKEGNEYKIKVFDLSSNNLGWMYIGEWGIFDLSADIYTTFDIKYDNIVTNKIFLYVNIRVNDVSSGHVVLNNGVLVLYHMGARAYYQNYENTNVFEFFLFT
jgi:hypothetical protein